MFYLPYMMGERSPHNDPYARGVFAGMSLDTDELHMAKAVMEGVCYALRDSVELARTQGIKIDTVRICGGGSKSRVWCEMIANILNVTVEKCKLSEGPALGAAIMSMVATGEYSTISEAVDAIVKIDEVIYCDKQIAEKYDKGYRKFTFLYKSLKDWFRYE